MKNKIINNSGYHPANITNGDVTLKHDNPPANNERIVSKENIVLYDCHERPLVRKIGFK